MSIPIEPISETTTITFTFVDVRVRNLNLGVSADVEVICYTSDFSQTSKYLVLAQPEYGQWGSNDQFVIDWALAQIGATPAPVE